MPETSPALVVPIPVPAATAAAEPVTVDHSELQSMQKRMAEMEVRLKKSEEEQRFLREKLELFMAGRLAPAAATAPATSYPSAPASAPAPTPATHRAVFYPPSKVPVHIYRDGTAKTNSACPYAS